MSDICRFTKAQYERFKSSKYIGIMYRDKMSMEVVLQKGNDILIKSDGGIDLKFYEDIFNPFITWR